MFRESIERILGGCPGGRDRGVAFALSVTGIIDEQKGIAGMLILGNQPSPIERERTIPAKRDPDSFRQLAAQSTRQIESDLFAGNRVEVKLNPIRRQKVRIARVVRPRMIKHRVLFEVENCNEPQNYNEDANEQSYRQSNGAHAPHSV